MKLYPPNKACLSSAHSLVWVEFNIIIRLVCLSVGFTMWLINCIIPRCGTYKHKHTPQWLCYTPQGTDGVPACLPDCSAVQWNGCWMFQPHRVAGPHGVGLLGSHSLLLLLLAVGVGSHHCSGTCSQVHGYVLMGSSTLPWIYYCSILYIYIYVCVWQKKTSLFYFSIEFWKV